MVFSPIALQLSLTSWQYLITKKICWLSFCNFNGWERKLLSQLFHCETENYYHIYNSNIYIYNNVYLSSVRTLSLYLHQNSNWLVGPKGQLVVIQVKLEGVYKLFVYPLFMQAMSQMPCHKVNIYPQWSWETGGNGGGLNAPDRPDGSLSTESADSVSFSTRVWRQQYTLHQFVL